MQLVLMAGILLVLVALALWTLQHRLVYYPAGAPPPVEHVLPGAEPVTIPTADGLQLDAWFLASGRVGVVVFPGNAGNRSLRAPLAEALADVGLSVLLIDYRGYGGNPGRPSEKGLLIDGRAAADWLSGRGGVEQVVYFGESIGAAVAIGVAGSRPPAALILRSPFTSLPDVARVHFGPVPDWLLRDRFDALGGIGSLAAPTLIIAAENDEIVPIRQSRRLHAAASEPKEFATIPGVGHNDPEMLNGPRLLEAVTEFLRRHDLIDGR